MSFTKTIQAFKDMPKIAKLKLRLHYIETVSKAIQKENRILKIEIEQKDRYIIMLRSYLKERGYKGL